MLISFDYLFEKYKIQPPGVLHLGANTGQEASMYHKHGIKRVIWVEAEESLFRKLANTIRRYPGSIALRACVSDKDGEEVDFHIASNGGQSSSILELGTHATEHPNVKYVDSVRMTTIRVDTLLKEYPPDNHRSQ